MMPCRDAEAPRAHLYQIISNNTERTNVWLFVLSVSIIKPDWFNGSLYYFKAM